MGVAERTGLESARIAAAGAQGSAAAYEGANGFLRAVAGITDEGTRAEVAAKTIDAIHDPWAVETLLLKPYPVCAINQSAVVRVVELLRAHPHLAQRAQEIRVTVSPSDFRYPGIVTSQTTSTWAQAMMSLPYCIAAAMTRGTVRFADLEPPVDADISKLMSKVYVQSSRMTPGGHAANVRVKLRDGTWLGDDSWTSIETSLESTDSLAQRLEAEGGLADAAYRELRDAVMGIDEVGGLMHLLEVIRQGYSAA